MHIFLSDEIYSIILDAASSGSIKLTELALKNWPTASPNDCIIAACRGGHFDLVKWLLEKGADPNQIDNKGRSCLYWTIVGDNSNPIVEYVKVLKLLMKNGLRLNKQQIKMASLHSRINYCYLRPFIFKTKEEIVGK